MQLFYKLHFEFSSTNKKPSGFKYLAAKDSIKWMGLKPRNYIPLLSSMFDKYVSSLL